MALVTKYGTQYGNRLLRTGRQFFVAPDTSAAAAQAYTGIAGQTVSASNNNDGLSPERPVATVDYAVNTLATQNGDMVILLPGVHTVLNQITPKAGVAIFGGEQAENGMLGPLGQGFSGPTVLTSTGTNIHLININANNVEIGYLTLRPTTAYSAVIFAQSAGTSAGGLSNAYTAPTVISGFYAHHLTLDLHTPAASVNTRGIDFGGRWTTGTGQAGRIGATPAGTVYGHLDSITCWGAAGQGEAIHYATCQVAAERLVFRCDVNNQAAGVWASAFIVASTVSNSVVENSVWIASGSSVPTYGSCIDGSQANAYNLDGITFSNCNFPRAGQLTYTAPYSPTSGGSSGPSGSLGSPAHGFPTNGVDFVNCYLAGQSTMYAYYSGGA